MMLRKRQHLGRRLPDAGWLDLDSVRRSELVFFAPSFFFEIAGVPMRSSHAIKQPNELPHAE